MRRDNILALRWALIVGVPLAIILAFLLVSIHRTYPEAHVMLGTIYNQNGSYSGSQTYFFDNTVICLDQTGENNFVNIIWNITLSRFDSYGYFPCRSSNAGYTQDISGFFDNYLNSYLTSSDNNMYKIIKDPSAPGNLVSFYMQNISAGKQWTFKLPWSD